MSSKKTKRLAAVLSLLSLMLLCLGLVACTLKTTYKVTLDYNADQGTVALSPQAENNEYEDGTELTVTVTPNEGFALDTFKLSTEDRDATPDNEGKFVFTIHEDTKITVTFKATEPVVEKYSITKNTPENGEIEISPAAGEDDKYEKDAEITVTLKPAQGYEVDTFTVGGADKKGDLNENVYKFNIAADTEINATFKATEPVVEKYSITKNTPENGEIEISPAAGEDDKYEKDAEITVTLKPAQGYEVDTFTVGGADKKGDLNENVYKFNLSADTEINATFKAKQFSVTTTFEAEQGSITLSPEATDNKYAYGTTVIVTVTAEENYEIKAFTVSTDAEAQLDGEGKYTLTVTTDTAISATFKAKEIPVSNISLSAQSLQLEVGREDQAKGTLTATIQPDNATTKVVEWSVQPASGTVSISAEGNTLTITPEATGSAVITASIGNASATCTVSVSQHQHDLKGETATIESKDADEHYLVCECGYKEAKSHTKALSFDQDDAEAGHYNACSVCGWKEDSKTEHSYTYNATNSNINHSKKCKCGYSVEEAHTYNESGSKAYKDGIKTDANSHWVECYVCHMHLFEAQHTLTITKLEDGSGKHHVKCSGSFSTFVDGNECPYDEDVECQGTELVPGEGENADYHFTKCATEGCGALFNKQAHSGDKGLFNDENDAENHYTICDCGAHYNPQPHKAEENGKCACGKDMQTHTHQPIADENGYYDGSCSCGDNIFFKTNGSGTITAFSADAQYTKIKIPTQIGEETITTFMGSTGGTFVNNTAITDIIVPQEVTLPSAAFSGCSQLLHVVILGSGAKNDLPANTFRDCSRLEWIVLSQQITSLNVNCFSSSPAVNKIKVYFMGAEETWNKMVTALKDPTSGKTNAKSVFQNSDSKILFLDNENADKAWYWETENVLPADGKKS